MHWRAIWTLSLGLAWSAGACQLSDFRAAERAERERERATIGVSSGSSARDAAPSDGGGCGIRNRTASAGDVPFCDAQVCQVYTAELEASVRASTEAHGSANGGQPYDQLCGPGEVLVGLAAAANSFYLYGFAALCAPLLLSGAAADLVLDVGEPRTLTPALGNDVTTPAAVVPLDCPRGSVVSAIRGCTGYVMPTEMQLFTIKQLELTCEQPQVAGDHTITLELETHVATNSGCDDDASAMFSEPCADGRVVVGLTGRSGAYIDDVHALCAPLTVAQHAGSSDVRAIR